MFGNCFQIQTIVPERDKVFSLVCRRSVTNWVKEADQNFIRAEFPFPFINIIKKNEMSEFWSELY